MHHRSSSFTAACEASSRVHRFCGPTATRLIVERWHGHESLSGELRCQIDLLGDEHEQDLDDWLTRPASITTRLPEGGEVVRVGLIRSVERVACVGSLVRYRVHLADWTAWLHDSRHSRVFQDEDVASIIDTVLSEHAPLAHWCWHAGSPSTLDRRCRGYRVQYRQSDMAFLQQLMAEEGLGWCIRARPEAPGGHTLMIIGDSTQCSVLPGLRRVHRTQRVVDSPGIAFLHESRRVVPTRMTRVTDNDDAFRVISASLPVRDAADGPLEDYSPARHAAWQTTREALAEVMREAEAALCDQRRWTGEGTEPDFEPGEAFEVLPVPGQRAAPALLLTAVNHAGVNLLPSVAELQQDLPACTLPDTVPAARAQALGYANRFQAIPLEQRWRRRLEDPDYRPTAPGPQLATVLGGDDGAPLHMDSAGRIRVRFGFATDGRAESGWLRVAQRFAGPGVGSQFLPRVGQEVVVDFINGDIRRPLVVGALYNGRGESRPDALALASDATSSAQNNLAGGQAPRWHAAGAGECAQRNAGAIWGISSQSWDGQGGSSLEFDDSDSQLQVRLGTTQRHSSLSLGQLRHQQHNFRGSLRGNGYELRSDAWGSVRATAGLWLDSTARTSSDPAGLRMAPVALLRQTLVLGQTFDDAARRHQTIRLRGCVRQASGSSVLQVLADSVAASRSISTAGEQVPATRSPVLGLSAPTGICQVAGQAFQMGVRDCTLLASGGSSAAIVVGHARWQGRQAIGVLAGAAHRADQTGLSVVAGEQQLDLQAQADAVLLQSRARLRATSGQGEVQLAAGRALHIATAEGAAITLTDGHLRVTCPGTLTFRAGRRTFVGPAQELFPLPQFPQTICVECLQKAMQAGLPWSLKNG
ncbi:type VI secretion system tip protein VgrG [Stenotrophomonas sp. GD04145]|uniref:type VI secretion system Vgr family protein n=1 Tax=Stenotrophomonas sp. GD04145 TaxID=2975436 RepID=UPI00244AFF54|nr:type VI secretion system tip protein TssI/VgrG [Stenotrophomonas sp. GD04145]MDH0172914.1 type VI secretion system tip protein VgrG [Stenotrophomonas sp. GD04145]